MTPQPPNPQSTEHFVAGHKMMSTDTQDELREKLKALYNESVMMGRLRTGSPIDHMVEGSLDLINSQALKLLDRLEAQWGETIDNTLGKPIRIKFVSVSAIQAERAKLEEVK